MRDEIDGLRIATPCSTSWELMEGDERVRHCAVCSLNVYNFAEMTREEVQALLARTEGRVCARLYRRADGTVLTRDCPKGLPELRHRASRVAAAAMAALLSVPAFAFGGSKKACVRTHGSKVNLTTEQVATTQPAAFTGAVVLDDNPLPGVTVTLRNEATKREFTFVTDNDGTFRITALNDGIYRVELALSGLKPTSIEHLELKSGAIVHARVAMRFDPTQQIVVGALAVEENHDALSTTFTQTFIDKLPL
ncbi:MAG TPA: carboxypeptidase-like regulatory domain-containing protein [Vicinamibacterales bacterium]